MRKGHWLALGALLGAMTFLLAVGPSAHSQRAEKQEGGNLTQKLARGAKLSEQDANRFLQALGPAIRAEMTAGKTVNIPGLGTFRVVRIPEHKDMAAGGRPVVVSAVNSVEFLPDGGLSSAANSPTAVPAEVVPPFQYIPLPGQTPGQKMGRTHVPGTRTPSP